MTIKEIEARKQQEMIKFDVATKIRQLLDEAKKAYGKEKWEEEDLDSEVSSLVFEE